MRASPARILVAVICAAVCAALAGCPAAPHRNASAKRQATAAQIQGVNLDDPLRPTVDDGPVAMAGAKNEWVSFAVQISNLAGDSRRYSLRLRPGRREGASDVLALESFSVEQILPMPVDVNRAGYVRHTGLSVENRPLPRALLPMRMENGVVKLSSARESAQPLLFWIDLHVPAQTRAGEYVTRCDLIGADPRQPVASVPVKITVYDFALPDERHVTLTSQLRWSDLVRLYPAEFETITPRLLNRNDPKYAKTIRVLDSLMSLAQRHRTELVVSRLQPIAKWPSGKPPQIDWGDVDTVLTPWLNGDAFADKVAINYWPLPGVDYLDRYDLRSQVQYWSQAAWHFDQKGWLDRSAVALEPAVPGRVSGAAALQMSADAAQILKAHPRVRVTLPLEEDQLHLASRNEPNFIDPQNAARLVAAAPGIIFNPPMQKWAGVETVRPQKWLRTDVPGLVQYVGAGGDERDVRVWSWLAFLRNAELVQWGSPLPRTNSPTEPADPDDLVWFYPGSWFGVDEPLATIQLKWLRRAEQDFEYLLLAKQRGETINAGMMARLLTKQVEIQPGQQPDPSYALMTGTADAPAWNAAQDLLGKLILSRDVGGEAKQKIASADELSLQVLRWIAPQDVVLLMGRSASWGLSAEGSNRLSLVLGIDVYNASDTHPEQNRLEWDQSIPRGWQVNPQPMPIGALQTYRVQTLGVEAAFDLNAIDVKDRRPVALRFVNGFNNAESKLQMVLPVAPTDRLGPGMNINDGKLDDWNAADAIQDGPMVRMFNRPAVQKQQIQYADESSHVYTGWGDEKFYVAFHLDGATASDARTSRNFVDYQFRRAWGEDLCEILIQPIYGDNSAGPVLHVVCKPTAGHWVERKRDPRLYADPWQPFEGTGIRYVARNEDGWSGEVAIPWKAITDRDKTIPKLLRFNFAQHVHSTGQSASWAGPVDFGRDDGFMGLLYVRESTEPGMAGPLR